MSSDSLPHEVIVVMCTVPDADTAARLARPLVEERLAACVNILPAVRSLYTWEGKLNDETEVLCLIKTRRSLYPALRDRIEALHPYQVPEIVALEITAGNAAYLAWVSASTQDR